MTPDEYCREIEAHLCRRNDGHLIRLVGPAFELVRAWVDRGIPLKIALRGIDRYFERPRAGRPRRRPVRIVACEPCVLDAFDDWRRAVGLGRGDRAAGRLGRGQGLRAHVDRAAERLVARRTDAAPELAAAVALTVERLEALRDPAGRTRGTAREAVVETLASLDRALMDAARRSARPEDLEALTRDADAELAAFRDRMEAAAYHRVRDAAVIRLLRERLGLPQVAYE